MDSMTPKKQENKEVLSVSKTSQPDVNERSELEIIEVWEDNFEEEMDKIAQLLDKYNYVAMDTEFPGVCIQGDNLTGYNLVKSNVDALKLIQVGITLADENGVTPQPTSTWQFNLKFDLKTDHFSPDSISMLKEAGIKFEELAERGIDPVHFADLMLSSGLILNEEVTWITFHGGFDFAYFVKVITDAQLPPTLDKFKASMKTFFPNLADIKVMMKEVHDLKCGALSKLARDLDLKRIGTMHQAGSDAEITLRCFFKLKEDYFKTGISAKLLNKVFGLSNEYQSSNTAPPVPQPKPNPQDLQRFNMYHQYVNQPAMGYYAPYGGAEFQAGYYYNPVEMPMMYTPAMSPAMNPSDFSGSFKL